MCVSVSVPVSLISVYYKTYTRTEFAVKQHLQPACLASHIIDLYISLLDNLGITSQSIKTVHEAIQNSHTFQSLLSINLSSNSMTTFPIGFADLPSLQKIILSGNMLGERISGQSVTAHFLTSHFITLSIRNFHGGILVSFILLCYVMFFRTIIAILNNDRYSLFLFYHFKWINLIIYNFIIDISKNEIFAFPQGLTSLDISNNKIDSDYFDDILCALNRHVRKNSFESLFHFGFIFSSCFFSEIRLLFRIFFSFCHVPLFFFKDFLLFLCSVYLTIWLNYSK